MTWSTHHETDIISHFALVTVGDKITNELWDSLINILRKKSKIREHTSGVKGEMACEVNGSASWRNITMMSWDHGNAVACFFKFPAFSANNGVSWVSSSTFMISVVRKKETRERCYWQVSNSIFGEITKNMTRKSFFWQNILFRPLPIHVFPWSGYVGLYSFGLTMLQLSVPFHSI